MFGADAPDWYLPLFKKAFLKDDLRSVQVQNCDKNRLYTHATRYNALFDVKRIGTKGFKGIPK